MPFELIQVPAILPQIRIIAQSAVLLADNSATDFRGYAEWEYPSPKEMKDAGLPYLVVPKPKKAGSAIGGRQVASEWIIRKSSQESGFLYREPLWDFEVLAFFVWDPKQKAKCFTDGWDAAQKLELAFQENTTLNSTCDSTLIGNPEVDRWTFLQENQGTRNPGLDFTVVTLPIRVFEQLF